MHFKSRIALTGLFLLVLSGAFASVERLGKGGGYKDDVKKNRGLSGSIYQLEGGQRDMVTSGPIDIAAEVERIYGKEELTLRYTVNDNTPQSFRLFNGASNVVLVANLELVVEIDDKRSDKTSPIKFGTNGIFDALPKLKKMAHVTVRFTSDVSIDLTTGNKGIIANSITISKDSSYSTKQILQDIGIYFTNKDKPITLTASILNDGSALLFGSITYGEVLNDDYYFSGLFVIGDNLIVSRSSDNKQQLSFSLVNKDLQSKISHYIFDVNTLTVTDVSTTSLIFNLLSYTNVGVKNSFILIREGLDNPSSSNSVTINSISFVSKVIDNTWIDIKIKSIQMLSTFNAISSASDSFENSYLILRVTSDAIIQYQSIYYLGSAFAGLIKNSYIQLIEFTSTVEPKLSSSSLASGSKGYLIGNGKIITGIEKIEEDAFINDASTKLTGYLVGQDSSGKSVIYLKLMPYYNSKYIVDVYKTFVKTGIEFNKDDKYLKINNVIVYDEYDENVVFNNAGERHDNFVYVGLLYPPSEDVTINGECSGDADQIDCNADPHTFNYDRYMIDSTYSLPLKIPESSTKVCIEVTTESVEVTFDGFSKKICHTLYNANYVPTIPPGGLECTEGEKCKFSINLKGIATGMFSSTVTISGGEPFNSGTAFCGVSYCSLDFTYPRNNIDDDDIYQVELFVKIKFIGINSGTGTIKVNVHDADTSGITARVVVNENSAIEDNVATVYFKLDTIPFNPVTINYICPSSLKCESDGLNDISDMTEHSVTVKREYTTIYDYSKENTVFTMMFLSSTSNDLKYANVKPSDQTITVKNDLKPEIIITEKSISYECGQSDSPKYHISYRRTPKTSIVITPKYDVENLNVKPNSGVLQDGKNELIISVDPIKVCRGNVSYEITHRIETEDELYKNVEIGSIMFNNIVYENQLDLTSPPVLQYVSESDTSYTLNIEFDKKCFIDNVVINQEFDCTKIFKQNNYQMTKCRMIDDTHFIANYTNKNANSDLLIIVEGVIRASDTGVRTSSGSRSIFGRSLPPYVVTADFSDDGSKIIVEFDQNIVEGISNLAEPCSKILSNTNLGTNAMCRLTSPRIMEISLSSDATIALKNFITIKPDSGIKSVKDHLYSANGISTVNAPTSPTKITAVINAPDEMGECATISVDGSLSQSHGGRKPTYIWGYSTEDSYIPTEDLKNCIKNANSKNEAALSIKGTYLNKGKNIITLKIKSFLNIESDIVYKTINSKKDGASIEATITGNSIQNYTKLGSFAISAKGKISVCDAVSDMNIKFEWSGLNKDTKKELDISQFTTANPRILNIPSKSLEIGNYVFTVKVTSSDDSLTSSSSIIVNIIPSDLVVVLSDGGNDRIQSDSSPLILDISKSYDPDEYDNEFNYKWECVMNGISQCIDVDGKALEFEMKSIITIKENVLRKDNIYIFTGRVLSKKTDRSSSISINVKVIEEKIDLSIHLKVSSVDHIYNPTDIFSIEGEIITSLSDLSEVSYKWSYPKNELNTNMFIGSIESDKIVVDCNKLSYGKESVLFTLSYKKMIFTSEYLFEIHSPPSGGYLVVSNKSVNFGEEIEITSSGWISKNKLYYRFGVLFSENNIQFVNDYSLNNKYKGYIPTGNAANHYKVTIVVKVKDERNAISYSNKYENGEEVIVISNPLQLDNAEQAHDTINNMIDKAKNVSEYDQIYTIVNSVSNQLVAGVCNLSNSDENKNVCLNEGNCVNNFCNCTSEYTGKYCENHKPIDCELSSEYEYGEYDRSCGIGHRKRWHPIKRNAEYGGKECEIIIEEDKSVYLGVCTDDVDGKWSEWSGWSDCDAVCSVYNNINVYGIEKRNRKCDSPKPSGNGKYCEGESVESRRCVKSCIAPYKPCPGQTINNNGEVVGRECNGNGICEYSNKPCFAYQAGCISYCICNNEYAGDSCNIELSELQKKRQMNDILAKSLEEAFNHSTNSLESHSLLSTSLLNLANPPVELFNTTKKNTLKLVNKVIENIKEDKSSESVPVDSLKSYLETSILFFTDETVENVKNKDNSDYYSKSLLNIISNVTSIYSSKATTSSNNNNKESLILKGESVSVNLMKRREDEMILKTDESEIELSEEVKGDTVEVIEWNNIPYNDIRDENLTSGLISISIHDNEGKRNIKDIEKPIFFTQKVSNYGSLKDIECSYYDEELGKMTFEGVYIYYIEEMSNNTALVTCATIHLSSFSTKVERILPKMNFVNPISDAHLLGNYNKENMIVPIILSVVIVVCCISWLYAKYTDSSELSIVSNEKAEKFLSVGLLDETIAEKKHEKEAKSFLSKFLMNMKQHHSWLAPTLRPVDEIVVINRSQRILCLTCQLMTSTAINALFFGSSPENVGQLISTSIISTLCMLPCTLIIPWLYKYANGCSSKTISNKRKWFTIKSLRNRFKSYLSSGISTPELLRLKAGLLITTGILLLVCILFYIISLIIMPFGAPSLITTLCLIIMIIEMLFSFICSNILSKPGFIYLFVVDLLIFIVNVIFLIICACLSNKSYGIIYNMWKVFSKNVATKEFNKYIENNLDCCGFYDINDYNVNDCLEKSLSVEVIRSCDVPLSDTFNKYSGMWGIFFILSILLMLIKMSMIGGYMLVNMNKIISEENDYDNEITKIAGNKMINFLRRSVMINKIKRKKEYVEWLRQRRIRSTITVCVNTTVFIYIVIMIYINLLYGVKFAPNQANSWIISSAISMSIDFLIQQPSLILLNSVATSTMGAVLNFAG